MQTKRLTILSLITIAASPSFAQFYTAGHADIGVALEDGTDFHLHFHGHAEGPPAVIDGITLTDDVEYDASEVTIVVPFAAMTTAPNNTAYNTGTGTSAGDDIWILPQGIEPDQPYLGIAAEELEAGDWSDISFTLGTVTSPTGNGELSVFQPTGISDFNFFFSTANGSSPIIESPGSHDHYIWAFTEAGDWLIELSVSGTHDTLGFMSDTQTFQFQVVPEPSAYAALLGLSALGFCTVRRHK